MLETRQKAIFFKHLTMQSPKWSQLFASVTSTKAHEDRIRVAGLGTFQTKPEGTPVAFSDPIEGTRRRVVHTVYALGYRVTKEAVDDDQWNVIDRMPSDLGESGADHKERIVWDVINDGYAGARHTGLDGQSLFNAAHTTLRPEVAAQSNIQSPPVALSTTGIEAMMTQAMTTQSEEGRFIDMEQGILLHHPTNSHKAHVLLETPQKTGSADNDVSTVERGRSGLVPLAVPYLTSTLAWSIHAGPGRNSLQWNDRESMTFSRAGDPDTFDEKHYAAYRGSPMFSEWRNNFGSNFS